MALPDEEQLDAKWKQLLAIRAVVLSALEQQRREKVIGSSLEARVVLNVVPDLHEFLQAYEKELPTLFIVSQVVVRPTEHPAGERQIIFSKASDEADWGL